MQASPFVMSKIGKKALKPLVKINFQATKSLPPEIEIMVEVGPYNAPG